MGRSEHPLCPAPHATVRPDASDQGVRRLVVTTAQTQRHTLLCPTLRLSFVLPAVGASLRRAAGKARKGGTIAAAGVELRRSATCTMAAANCTTNFVSWPKDVLSGRLPCRWCQAEPPLPHEAVAPSPILATTGSPLPPLPLPPNAFLPNLRNSAERHSVKPAGAEETRLPQTPPARKTASSRLHPVVPPPKGLMKVSPLQNRLPVRHRVGIAPRKETLSF